MAFLATPLLIYFAYETILMKNFSFSDVKEIEKFKKNFSMWVVCCQTGVVSNFVFWTFSYVVVIGLAWNFKISSKE
jgi:hypothetical protein